MIKMISFNNFDNFDGKTNVLTEEDFAATAQDFTAILGTFSPPAAAPKPSEPMPPNSVQVTNKEFTVAPQAAVEPFQAPKENQSNLYQPEFPNIKQNGEILKGDIPVNYLNTEDGGNSKAFTAPGESPPILPVEPGESAPFINKKSFAPTGDSAPFINRKTFEPAKQETILDLPDDRTPLPDIEPVKGSGLPKEFFQTDKNPFAAQNDSNNLVAPEYADETVENTQTNKGDIPVNYLNTEDGGNSKAFTAPGESPPILPVEPGESAPFINKKSFAPTGDSAPFINRKSTPENPPEGRIPTQFDADGVKNPSMWSRSQSIPRETPAKIEDVRLSNIANEQRREAGNLRFVAKQDSILDLPLSDRSAKYSGNTEKNPLLDIGNGQTETVEVLSVPTSGAKPQSLAAFETEQVKPAAAQGDILEFPDLQNKAAEEIAEIKTDNFELLDLTRFESTETVEMPVKTELAEYETEIPAPNEQLETVEPVKPAAPLAGETKVNTDSVQFKNLKYFFNTETNRVDEVNTATLPANASEFSENQTPNTKKDSTIYSPPINGLTKLYDTVSEIVRADGASEKNQAEIQTAEVKAQNTSANQIEDLWAGYTEKNPAQMTNPIRANKPRGDVFTNQAQTTDSITETTSRPSSAQELFDEYGILQPNEDRNLQDFAPPQIINSPANPGQEMSGFTNQTAVSPDSLTTSEISLTQAETPIPKPEKNFKMSNDFAGLSFEKFLNPALASAEVIEVSPNSLIADSAVIEQVEPRILEMARLVDKTEETELLKMRLNPAELGSIEIRLEKDASGKINASIQTQNESAQQILSESLGQLRDTLQNSGWQVDKLEVTYNPNQSNGTDTRENGSREFENGETGSSKAFGFDANVENEDETPDDPALRLVNLRA